MLRDILKLDVKTRLRYIFFKPKKTYDVSSVSVGVSFDGLQHDPEPDLVAALRLEGDRAILGVARLSSIAWKRN
jgi:hypothetical protein